MPREVILTDKAPKPLAVYSQAIRAGSLLFLSGQIPLDPATGELKCGSVTEETHQVLKNLEAVLAAAGASLRDVVKIQVFLVDMGDFAEFNRAYAVHFPSEPPARSTVAVRTLPRDVRVEIDAIALVPNTG
jgi:2-iminobutanoate/2-iminopropanoate deaminase